jgi:hypothetical protein
VWKCKLNSDYMLYLFSGTRSDYLFFVCTHKCATLHSQWCQKHILWDLRFSQCCCWGFMSSGMQCCFTGRVVIGYFEGSWCLQNIRNLSLSDTAKQTWILSNVSHSTSNVTNNLANNLYPDHCCMSTSVSHHIEVIQRSLRWWNNFLEQIWTYLCVCKRAKIIGNLENGLYLFH